MKFERRKQEVSVNEYQKMIAVKRKKTEKKVQDKAGNWEKEEKVKNTERNNFKNASKVLKTISKGRSSCNQKNIYIMKNFINYVELELG